MEDRLIFDTGLAGVRGGQLQEEIQRVTGLTVEVTYYEGGVIAIPRTPETERYMDTIASVVRDHVPRLTPEEQAEMDATTRLAAIDPAAVANAPDAVDIAEIVAQVRELRRIVADLLVLVRRA